MPDAPSPAREELPEEIEKAIEALRDAEHRHGGSYFSDSSNEARLERLAEQACEGLTAAILSRLGEADAGREEALRERDEKHAELLAFGERYDAEDRRLDAEMSALEAARDAALARVERLEKALNEAADWHDSAADDLAGLPQNSHTHWWRTIHGQRSDEIRSALTEAGRLAIKDA